MYEEPTVWVKADKLLELWRKNGGPGLGKDVCDWAIQKIEDLQAAVDRLKHFAAGRGSVSEADDWTETALLVDGLYDRVDRLRAENNRLHDAWFIDETMQDDGSLRPSLRDTLERLEALEIENADLREREEYWTPCKNSEPTKTDWYLVTPERGKRVAFAYYSASTGIWDTTYRVIAWRKLPKIYKETGDE